MKSLFFFVGPTGSILSIYWVSKVIDVLNPLGIDILLEIALISLTIRLDDASK